jgi:hypothetical protein
VSTWWSLDLHRLGVSRVPIREALQLLYRDGWVDLRPHQGAFVHEPSVQEVDEVFSVRTLLEVESARLAAMNVTKESLQSLSELLEVPLSLRDGGLLSRVACHQQEAASQEAAAGTGIHRRSDPGGRRSISAVCLSASPSLELSLTSTRVPQGVERLLLQNQVSTLLLNVRTKRASAHGGRVEA